MLKLEFSSLLSIRILPYDGVYSFDRHLNVVVLPAPFTPRKPKHSPYSKQNDKFLTAFVIVFSLLQKKIFIKIFCQILYYNSII